MAARGLSRPCLRPASLARPPLGQGQALRNGVRRRRRADGWGVVGRSDHGHASTSWLPSVRMPMAVSSPLVSWPPGLQLTTRRSSFRPFIASFGPSTLRFTADPLRRHAWSPSFYPAATVVQAAAAAVGGFESLAACAASCSLGRALASSHQAGHSHLVGSSAQATPLGRSLRVGPPRAEIGSAAAPGGLRPQSREGSIWPPQGFLIPPSPPPTVLARSPSPPKTSTALPHPRDAAVCIPQPALSAAPAMPWEWGDAGGRPKRSFDAHRDPPRPSPDALRREDDLRR